ncbi:Fibrinogen-like protein A [Apostichopus japonicus]|uniref:Fibrinogen-like protein A n=1 Tax=Stichopus japonicus TaxID=307972 RepID=A0A2G8K2W8_STIJA|nr:Fibrinogen-like protein A [Apostichopus japonicus]
MELYLQQFYDLFSSSSYIIVVLDLQYFLFQTPEYPRDCHEVLNQCSSTNAKSGVYLIKPDQYPEPFQTYCDHNTTSGGWTIYPFTWCSSNKDNYDNTCERTCENPMIVSYRIQGSREMSLSENHMVLGDSCIPKSNVAVTSRDSVVLAEGESYINSDCSLRITCNSNVLTSESYSCSADATCEERNDVRRCYCNEWFEGDGLTCTRSGPKIVLICTQQTEQITEHIPFIPLKALVLKFIVKCLVVVGQ